MSKNILMNQEEFKRTLKRLSHEIIEKYINDLDNIAIIGIRTRGEFLAKRIPFEEIISTKKQFNTYMSSRVLF